MTNEMIRPCTLWGQTFDACYVDEVCQCDKTLSRYEADAIIRGEKLDPRPKTSLQVIVWLCGKMVRSKVVETYEDYYILFQETITTIADALNAPVLATKEVLAGLPRDANVVSIKNGRIVGTMVFDLEDEQWKYLAWRNAPHLGTFGHIQAFRCSKTADYLRQFTLDGVRKETKGSD